MARGTPAFTRRVEEGDQGGAAWAQLGSQQWRWKGQAEAKADLHDCIWLGWSRKQRIPERDKGEFQRKAAGGGREVGDDLEGEPEPQEQLKGRRGGGEESGCERGEGDQAGEWG